MSYKEAKEILFQVGTVRRETHILNCFPLHTPSKPPLLLLLAVVVLLHNITIFIIIHVPYFTAV